MEGCSGKKRLRRTMEVKWSRHRNMDKAVSAAAMSEADSENPRSVSESLSESEIIVMTPTYSSPALTQTYRVKYSVTSLNLGLFGLVLK